MKTAIVLAIIALIAALAFAARPRRIEIESGTPDSRKAEGFVPDDVQ